MNIYKFKKYFVIYIYIYDPLKTNIYLAKTNYNHKRKGTTSGLVGPTNSTCRLTRIHSYHLLSLNDIIKKRKSTWQNFEGYCFRFTYYYYY